MNYFFGYTPPQLDAVEPAVQIGDRFIPHRERIQPAEGDAVFLIVGSRAFDGYRLVTFYSIGVLEEHAAAFRVMPDNIRPLPGLSIPKELATDLPRLGEGDDLSVLIPLDRRIGKALFGIVREYLKTRKAPLTTGAGGGVTAAAEDEGDVEFASRATKRAAGRLGQGPFRDRLLKVYRGRCAITRCGIEGALSAAHIREYSKDPNQDITNGLLLRADIHALFDRHLLRIYPAERPIVVLTDPLLNSKTYKRLQHKELLLPKKKRWWPNGEKLWGRWHAANELGGQVEPPPSHRK